MGRILNTMFAGRDLREKVNVAAGTAIGLAVPILIFRYTGFLDSPESINMLQEANYWTISTVAGFGSLLSPIAGFFGYTLGVMEAGSLRRKRQGREWGRYSQARDGLEEIPKEP